MMRTLFLLITLALPAQAQDAPILAEYWTNNGSLPPEYAWETDVTLRADGTLTMKHCKGYETEGPACKIRSAKVAEAALTAILVAARESGLAESPARETEFPMVGGGLTGGLVYLDGQPIKLLSQPDEADVPRVRPVLQAIADAIPPRFARFLDAD